MSDPIANHSLAMLYMALMSEPDLSAAVTEFTSQWKRARDYKVAMRDLEHEHRKSALRIV